MRKGVPVTILKYVTGEFAKTAALSLVIVTVLWVFVSAIQVIRHQFVGPKQFLFSLPPLTLISLAYTLPMSILFGASVSYGRMSSENEIRAMEWNGLHVGWIMLPALLIALGATAVSLFLTANVVPASRVYLKSLVRANLSDVIGRQLHKAAQEGRSLEIPGLTVTLKEYDQKAAVMRGVAIRQSDGTHVLRTIDAPSARIVPGRQAGAAPVAVYGDKPESERRYVTFIFEGGRIKEYDPTSGMMTATGVAPPVALDLSENEDEKKRVNPKELSLSRVLALSRETAEPNARCKARTIFFERLALGLSPFFFAFLAVPMAMVARWKHMLTSFLPSLLVVVALYYPLIMWAKVQGEAGRLDPMYGMFIGNAAVLLLGAALTLKLVRR